jgi:hypothetical protein
MMAGVMELHDLAGDGGLERAIVVYLANCQHHRAANSTRT